MSSTALLPQAFLSKAFLSNGFPAKQPSSPLLSIMLLPMDSLAHALRIVTQMSALAGRDLAVRFGSRLVPMKPRFTTSQAARLGARELAGLHALFDALALILLAGIHDWRLGGVRRSA